VPIALIVLLHATITTAQINIKVGYSTNFLSGSTNNEILSAFNEVKIADGVDLAIPMSDLNTLHGINIGLRYLLSNNNALELTYESMGRKREALGTNPGSTLFQKEIFYSFKQYMIGYQSILGGFGFGTSFGYNNVQIKEELPSSDRKVTFLKEGQWIARFNLALYYKSTDLVSLSIQPYYQFAIQDLDLSDLSGRLGVTSLSNPTEKFSNFGLTIIIYNGSQ